MVHIAPGMASSSSSRTRSVEPELKLHNLDCSWGGQMQLAASLHNRRLRGIFKLSEYCWHPDGRLSLRQFLPLTLNGNLLLRPLGLMDKHPPALWCAQLGRSYSSSVSGRSREAEKYT